MKLTELKDITAKPIDDEEPEIPEADEKNTRKLVVVYGGRFQPFHLGHYHAYRWLCRKFGKQNVWIATSNKTNFKAEEGKVSPFSFIEKQELIVTLYGVRPRRVVECKNPAFSPKEIFQQYKGYDLVYLSAVGKKDAERYEKSDFFSKLPKDFKLEDLSLAKEGGYYTIVPMGESGLSGTEVRNRILQAETKTELKKVFKQVFGEYDDVIAEMVQAKLKEVVAKPKKEEPKEEESDEPEEPVEDEQDVKKKPSKKGEEE